MQPTTVKQETVVKLSKQVKTPITLSWITSVLILGTSIIYFFLAQPELPLFYSVATKQDQLSNKVFLFLFPIVSIVINLLHFFIARVLKRYSVVLLKLFVGTTLGLQLLLGFALVRIILITF